MKIKDWIVRHWVLVIAMIILVLSIAFNGKFRQLIESSTLSTDTFFESALKEKRPTDDMIVDESGSGQVFIDPGKKSIKKEPVHKPVQKRTKSRPAVVSRPEPEKTPAPTAPQKEPLLFSEKKQHINIFKPYYISEDKEKVVEKPGFTAVYKGYYNLEKEKIAIFKTADGLVYGKQGQLLGASDYIIAEIELKWVKITNIHNSNNVILYLGGNKQ